MASLVKKLTEWVRYSEARERDAFLSRAADYADLERRIRIWENRERPFFSPGRFDGC